MSRTFFLEIKNWKRIINAIETKNRGLADTLAIMADPKSALLLKKGEKDIRQGLLVPLDEV